jgi:hypothetical protein
VEPPTSTQPRPAARVGLTSPGAGARGGGNRRRTCVSLAVRDDTAALHAADEALTYFGKTVQIRAAEPLLQRGRILARQDRPADAEASWRRGIAIVEDQRPSLRDELMRVSRTAALWDLIPS